MRPNSRYQQLLVSHLFRGNDVLVYSVPRGKLYMPCLTHFIRLNPSRYTFKSMKVWDELNESRN